MSLALSSSTSTLVASVFLEGRNEHQYDLSSTDKKTEVKSSAKLLISETSHRVDFPQEGCSVVRTEAGVPGVPFPLRSLHLPLSLSQDLVPGVSLKSCKRTTNSLQATVVTGMQVNFH